MTKTLKFKNNQLIRKSDIPVVDFNEFALLISDTHYRVANLFVNQEEYKNNLYAIIANDKNAELHIISTIIGNEYPSLTLKRPSVHMFEREIYENFKIRPIDHPWLKPVRANEGYEFLKSDDHQSHEVAVGPVHAGIIEPGHFRFLCQGERVMHLEIQLGWQQRGVEKLLKNKPSVQLAESICGDTTIGHSLAFARAMEAVQGIKVCPRAKTIRKIALEMERMAIHIGDIGAIAGDIAYLMASEVLGVTRTLVINTMLEISGSRFGKGLMRIGGVNFDINDELQIKIKSMLEEVDTRVSEMCDAMFSNATVLSRLENTGYIGAKKAEELGMVGPAGRASGQKTDCRIFEDYKNFEIINTNNGDVWSRTYQRYLEIKQSKSIILALLDDLCGKLETPTQTTTLEKDTICISMLEGWRGEICHAIITDSNGQIEQYKIKDPSFHNWYGLAYAVRNNQISDFPVCNKSFNLSYCGFDL